jgi:DNA polymerase-3 subunit beta
MKLATQSTQLAQALALRDKKARMTAHLLAAEDALSIITCDGITATKTMVSANIFEPGEIAVSADLLGKLAACFVDADVIVMTTAGNAVTIASGRGHYRLPLADVPAQLAVASNAGEITLPSADLLTLFEPLPAVGRDTTRSYLCGLYLHVADGRFYGVCTNGVTLLRTSVAVDTSLPGTIVPSSAVAAMNRLIRQTKPERVMLRRGGTLLEVVTPAFTCVTRTIDATYPDYERILPPITATTATCSRSALRAALGRLALVATAMPLVGMTWLAGEPLHLSLLREPHTGGDVIAAEAQGEAQIALALPALSSLIDMFDGDTLRIEVNQNRAIVIRAGSKLGVLTACRWNFREAVARIA